MTRRLAIRYTLFLADGTEVENNRWEAPLIYTEGSGELLPALDRALRDLAPGQTRLVEVCADDAYGQYSPDALHTVSLFNLPAEARHVGVMMTVGDERDSYRPARVHAIEGEQAILDLNHPLAGKDLVFEVTILEALEE